MPPSLVWQPEGQVGNRTQFTLIWYINKYQFSLLFPERVPHALCLCVWHCTRVKSSYIVWISCPNPCSWDGSLDSKWLWKVITTLLLPRRGQIRWVFPFYLWCLTNDWMIVLENFSTCSSSEQTIILSEKSQQDLPPDTSSSIKLVWYVGPT